MDEKYIGRICPYCKTEITETDEISVCPYCKTAMHAACREEAGRCVAVGCSGAPQGSAEKIAETEDIPVPVGSAADGAEENLPPEDTEEPPTAPYGGGESAARVEDIYRNPSFCPACGARVQDGAQSCLVCGFVFSSHPAASHVEKGKKKKMSKPLLAVIIAAIICVVIAAGTAVGIIGGRYIRAEAMEELSEELCDTMWKSPEITEKTFENSLFTTDCYIGFDGSYMRVYVTIPVIGASEVGSFSYAVTAPGKVTMTADDGETYEYSVKYIDSEGADSMVWTSDSGDVLNFNEYTSPSTYFD